MDNKQIIYFSETHPGMTLKEFADSLKEKEEELEHNIWDVLTNLAGGDPRKKSFDFQDMVEALSVDFGFDYTGSDDEKECHHFTDGNYGLVIYPLYYYPKQGELRIFNLQIF